MGFESRMKPVKASILQLIDSIKCDKMKYRNLQRKKEEACNAELRRGNKKRKNGVRS